MIRRWLIALIREAVRAEVEMHFRTLEDKAAQTETAMCGIAVRVKDKVDGKKPAIGQQWGARRVMLEQEAELKG